MSMLFHFDEWQLILVGSCVLRHFLSRLRCILEKQDDPYLAHVTFPAPNWESAIPLKELWFLWRKMASRQSGHERY